MEQWALAEKQFVDSSRRFCANTCTVWISSTMIAQLGESVHPVCFISPDIRLLNASDRAPLRPKTRVQIAMSSRSQMLLFAVIKGLK